MKQRENLLCGVFKKKQKNSKSSFNSYLSVTLHILKEIFASCIIPGCLGKKVKHPHVIPCKYRMENNCVLSFSFAFLPIL